MNILKDEVPSDEEMIMAIMDWETNNWKIASFSYDLITCWLETKHIICLSVHQGDILVTYCTHLGRVIAYHNFEIHNPNHRNLYKLWHHVTKYNQYHNTEKNQCQL